MRRFALYLTLSSTVAFPILAEDVVCEGLNLTVHTVRSAEKELICQAATRAALQFQQCNLPFPTGPLRIDVTDDVSAHCLAVYHCGEDWIEILSLDSLQKRRETQGAFAPVGTKALYESVVVHELAHAAFESVPCPFDDCIATNEYVAYVMQIMSFDAATRLEFERESDLGRPVSRDELSAMIYLLAPGRFAQKAWAHFSQREDPCGYLSEIVAGSVLLDIERP